MKKKLVSIVIPLYNGANYIEEALKSALAQTYKNIEIVVVNDGSTDGGAAKAICDRYAGKIVYFEKENGGCSSALNFGIRHANGEFVSWLSHDDLYAPTKIEKQIATYENKSLDLNSVIVGNAGSLIDAEGKDIWHPKKHASGFFDAESAFKHMLTACPNGCGLLIPKSMFEKYGYFDESLRFVLDWNRWLNFALRGVSFYFDPEVLVFNRVHSMQVTVCQKELHLQETNKTVEQLFLTMQENGADDTYWRALYEFSYSSNRGDVKSIHACLMERNVKIDHVRLIIKKAKSKLVRFVKVMYRKLVRFMN